MSWERCVVCGDRGGGGCAMRRAASPRRRGARELLRKNNDKSFGSRTINRRKRRFAAKNGAEGRGG